MIPMAATLYESSQNHIAEAEAALRQGDVAHARSAYAQAAADQERLVASIPPDRAKTRATYGLSAATLFYRANLLDEAERLVCLLLADGSTAENTKVKLRALFARIDNERLLQRQGLTGGRKVEKVGNARSDKPMVGLLRAVDLDARAVRIDADNGERFPIRIPESIRDDEIGLLLNRRVRARRVLGRRGKRLLVEDLEPWDG